MQLPVGEVTVTDQSRSKMTRQWSIILIPRNPGNQARIWNRKWDTHAVFGNLSEVVKTRAQSRPSRLPAEQGVAADNGPCFHGTKCSLCPPELPRFYGGDWLCPAQHVRRSVCVINHRVKAAGAERPRGGERERRRQADRDPGHPWRPGSASIGSKWKSGGKNDHIWSTLRQRWDTVTSTSPPYLSWAPPLMSDGYMKSRG